MGADEHRRGRRGYHHGNLKAALVEATRRLIAEKGPNGFTVAEAARLADVSPSAPYRHFSDRDALLREVATQGFSAFANQLEDAWSDPALTPLQALDALGRAYLRFASKEPAAFTAMFEADLAGVDSVELHQAADRAFSVLQRAVDALIARGPAKGRPPAMMVSHHIWAMSHGVATLYAHRAGRAPLSAEDMLESCVGVYLRGLGLID